jgi:molybdenum cofactor biosynthesis enzyme MoaA
MLIAEPDLDVVMQPFGSFVSRRSINTFDVLNRPATACLLRILANAYDPASADVRLLDILRKKGYIEVLDSSMDMQQEQGDPKTSFINDRNVLKATRAEIEVTNRCNLNCKYCYSEVNKSRTELSLSQWKEVLLGMHEHGLRAALFSGGEPFIRPDFLDLLNWASSRFIVEVNTNGFYITEATAERMADLHLKMVQVSVDSADSQYHDSVRGRNSHSVAITAVKRLVAKGVPTQISCVITKTNADSLSDLKELANSLGAAFKADPVTRTGYARRIDDLEWNRDFQATKEDRLEPEPSKASPFVFTPICQSQVGYVAVSHGGLLKPCNMREGFFEPVDSQLFSDHASAWWQNFYGQTRLGSLGLENVVNYHDFPPQMDSQGRYVCSMQSLYLHLEKERHKRKAGAHFK